MQAERRALYNSLRIHWLSDPSLEVSDWQVEDYRSMSLEALFDRLKQNQIHLDRTSFLAFAEDVESPEDLTDHLVVDTSLNDTEEDRIYLIIFELWRRLVPEKRCLSIFCDELDHQIYLYDTDQITNLEPLEDVLDSLKQILDENVDEGIDPQDVFSSICLACAHDVEGFLYDFICAQMDEDNHAYASELFDSFQDYLHDLKRREWLHIRILFLSDPETANQLLEKLVKKTATDNDLDFHFDLLSLLVQEGEKGLFVTLAKHTLNHLQTETDFQDLLALCADYYHCLDYDQAEQAIQTILDLRKDKSLDSTLDSNDPQVAALKKILLKVR